MNVKTFGAFAALALLAACSTPADTTSASAAGAGGLGGGGAGSVTPGSQEDLVASGNDRVFFATNASALTSESRGKLDQQAAFLSKYPQDNVQIAGNCDERSTEEFNIALGQRRANSARDYIVARGVAGSRVTTISYGKDRPTALGSDESSWQQNRNAITSVR